MTRVVVLDSGPVGLLTSPGTSEASVACHAWLESVGRNAWVVLPEIVDYEIRREILRRKRFAALRRLDELKASVDYQPITTAIMLEAAELWAVARQRGHPLAGDTSLDGDVILAAQARSLADDDRPVIVATSNVRHLRRFVDADTWERIPIA